MSRLLIISNMSHYQSGHEILGWGPTVLEIDQLGQLFDQIDHIACLHREAPPASSLPYQCGKVRLIPVAPSGGPRLKHKLGIFRQLPGYARIILRELPRADAVHIRCPANICLLALVLLAVRRQPRCRWFKYAGDWQRSGNEPLSYSFQRWWLKRGWSRGWVTVNGDFPGQPPHVRPFFNPCLDKVELGESRDTAPRELPGRTLRIVFVGSLNANKGVLRTLEILRLLRASSIDARLEVVGDGAERGALERAIAAQNLQDVVVFHGWLPRPALGPIYNRNHLFLLTSKTEGWPKVLSEAMAYGVVPIASAISCIPDYLSRFRTGRTVCWPDLPAFATAALGYARDPGSWKVESDRARAAATNFTYSHYLDQVRELLNVG